MLISILRPTGRERDFKINGPSKTIIDGSLKHGKLVNKTISPAGIIKVHLKEIESQEHPAK